MIIEINKWMLILRVAIDFANIKKYIVCWTDVFSINFDTENQKFWFSKPEMVIIVGRMTKIC